MTKNPLAPLGFSNSLLSNSTSCISPIPLSASRRLSINTSISVGEIIHNQVSPLVDCSPTQSFKSSYWMRRFRWSSWVYSSPLGWYLDLQRTDGLCATWLICHGVEFLVNSLRSSTYWWFGSLTTKHQVKWWHIERNCYNINSTSPSDYQTDGNRYITAQCCSKKKKTFICLGQQVRYVDILRYVLVLICHYKLHAWDKESTKITQKVH